MELKELLSYIEANRSIKKTDYCKKLGISTTQYWRIMNGTNEPSAKLVFDMVKLLGYELTLSIKVKT